MKKEERGSKGNRSKKKNKLVKCLEEKKEEKKKFLELAAKIKPLLKKIPAHVVGKPENMTWKQWIILNISIFLVKRIEKLGVYIIEKCVKYQRKMWKKFYELGATNENK